VLDLPPELLTKLIEQAPAIAVLLYLFWRLDRRMDACYSSMREVLDRLLEKVMDDETTHPD